jgi:ribosome biogenesis GTPase / thiamine phosphate phosphatase
MLPPPSLGIPASNSCLEFLLYQSDNVKLYYYSMQMKNKFYNKHKSQTKHYHTARHEKRDGTEHVGTVVAHFGAVVEVEDDAGVIFRCHLRKNQEPVITGDHVLWHLEKDNTGIVIDCLTRKSLLSRLETSHRNKLIAANIDAIVIVTAPPPNFSEHVLDRYLVAAENVQVPSIIVLNKVDLLDDMALTQMKKRLDKYAKIGYEVIYSSIFITGGLLELSQALNNKCCVLVGVSGVGKSSIIMALTGLTDIKVNEISFSKQGKHTTTAARLYHLPAGGSVIDSPGVREFSLWNRQPDEVIKGFIEFQPFLGRCQFRNCHHQTEPGCALQLAVAEEKISPERWESYLEIINQKKGK